MARSSAVEAVERFDTADAASKYARSLVGSATDRREQKRIRRGLAELARGSRVLDLPCGTGRLTPLLHEMGLKVVSADSSAHMVQLARESAEQHGLSQSADNFVVANVMETPFEESEFDGVVCNRLIHHFREPDVRRAALRELRRICRGPIVVSFFCSLAWDAIVFRFKELFAKEPARDRIPISYRTFANDCRDAGLTIEKIMPTRPGISKQWYLVLRRAAASD